MVCVRRKAISMQSALPEVIVTPRAYVFPVSGLYIEQNTIHVTLKIPSYLLLPYMCNAYCIVDLTILTNAPNFRRKNPTFGAGILSLMADETRELLALCGIFLSEPIGLFAAHIH